MASRFAPTAPDGVKRRDAYSAVTRVRLRIGPHDGRSAPVRCVGVLGWRACVRLGAALDPYSLRPLAGRAISTGQSA